MKKFNNIYILERFLLVMHIKINFLMLVRYSILLLLSVGLLFTSCKRPYKKYENMDVIENTYTGKIEITSTGTDPAGDFTGNGDSGTYAFVWENDKKTAQLNYDITTKSGSVQFILLDARGDEVLNHTITVGDDDTFSGVSEPGKRGKWLVKIVLNNFHGDGSFSISPGD